MPKQISYFAKLFGVSSFLHLVLISSILFLWQKPNNQAHQLVINRRVTPASIVLLPLVKTVPGALAALSQQQKKQSPKIVAQPKPKPTPPKKVAAAPQKKAQPKPPQRKTTLAKKEPPKPKTPVAKKQPPVNKPASVAKKQPEKKSLPVAKQTVPKKVPTPAPKVVQKKEVAPKDLLSTTTHNESEIIYVGRDDLVLLKNHQAMQQDIERVWKPPVGLSKDLMCTVAVALNNNGTIQSLAVEESSKVLSYDVTARMALSKVSFPKMFWGKKLAITFKQ